MRVICNTVDEFLQDLKTQLDLVGRDCVFQTCIRLSVVAQPTAESSKGNSVRDLINLQASAIVFQPTGDLESQYLMEVGVYCGIDYNDSTQEKGGSEQAEKYKLMIREFCDDNGLRVRPGVIQS